MSSFVHTDRCVPGRPIAGTTLLRAGVMAAKAVLGWPLRVHANRRLLAQMAGMSAYELADIGLTSADVRDTGALPLGAEIGDFLSARVATRRCGQRARRA